MGAKQSAPAPPGFICGISGDVITKPSDVVFSKEPCTAFTRNFNGRFVVTIAKDNQECIDKLRSMAFDLRTGRLANGSIAPYTKYDAYGPHTWWHCNATTMIAV